MNKDYALLGFVADVTGLSTNDIANVLRATGRYKDMVESTKRKKEKEKAEAENLAKMLTELIKKEQHTEGIV